MAFGLDIEGRIELSGLSPDEATRLAARLASALRKVRASSVSQLGSSVNFRNKVFRLVSSWNILGPVGWGTIDVHPGDPGFVAYKFSCLQMLKVTMGMALLLTSFTLLWGEPWYFPLGSFTFMWGWLYGANYVTSWIRLPNFVRSALGDAIRRR